MSHKLEWTFDEAVAAIPLIQPLLAALREAVVACRHYELAHRRTGQEAATVWAEHHRRKGREALERIQGQGVTVVFPAHRGIALFPTSVITTTDGRRLRHLAWLVYRDSRTTIDEYVLAGELAASIDHHPNRESDLDGLVRPVADWAGCPTPLEVNYPYP